MGRPIIDLTGQRFGALLVIGPPYRDPLLGRLANTMWPSRCDCGAVHQMRADHLKTKIRNGCVVCLGGPRSTHRKAGTHIYATWCRMKIRCLNVNSPDYPDYGARGITICDRWLNSFEAFYEDMGDKPTARHSIDRIDVNGNYEPSNCRWATPAQQSQNTRRTRLTLDSAAEIRALLTQGVRQFEIAKQFNVPTSVVYGIKAGRTWRPENL